MDYPMIISLTLITISFFDLSSSQTTQTPHLVGDICQQAALIPPTTFKDCVATFASKPGSSSADLKGLAGITLRSALANATEAGKYVEGLLKDGSLGPALRKCSSAFTAAASSFESALVEIEEDVMSANYDAKIAGDDARNCRAALAAGKVSEPAVEVRVGYLVLYSGIADVVTDRLYKMSL